MFGRRDAGPDAFKRREAMTVDLTKEERIQYDECLGQCTTCSFTGACELQKKIKEEVQDESKNERKP